MKRNVKNSIIRICLGSSCYTRGNAENLKIIQSFVESKNIAAIIDFRGHLCKEKCSKGPVFSIDDTVYEKIETKEVLKILEDKFGK